MKKLPSMSELFKIKEAHDLPSDNGQDYSKHDDWLRKQGAERASAKRSSDAEYASRGDSRNKPDDKWKYRSNY